MCLSTGSGKDLPGYGWIILQQLPREATEGQPAVHDSSGCLPWFSLGESPNSMGNSRKALIVLLCPCTSLVRDCSSFSTPHITHGVNSKLSQAAVPDLLLLIFCTYLVQLERAATFGLSPSRKSG